MVPIFPVSHFQSPLNLKVMVVTLKITRLRCWLLKFKSNNNETYNSFFCLPRTNSSNRKIIWFCCWCGWYTLPVAKTSPSISFTHSTPCHKLWSSKSFPSTWQQAVVLPISKIDMDKSDLSSYCPIALTSCLCKVVERMINGRLVWYLEKSKLITNMQSGFRKQRSTTDNLVRLETSIPEAFVQKQHALAVFFVLEKA